MSVNIEQIMNDIKSEISEKGYTADMLSFNEVVAAVGWKEGDGFFESEYKSVVSYLGSSHVVPVSMQLSGNPIVVFIKKLIRKFTRVTIRPVSEHQTEYNAYIAKAFAMIGAYIENNCNESIAQLSEKITMLELKLKTASKEIEVLNARISELEAGK